MNFNMNGGEQQMQNMFSYPRNDPYPQNMMFPMNEGYNLYGQNKTGHWTEKQNAKYYAFLKRFQDKFSQKESRRHWKVFKSLADFIKTRNPNQCRSHHHKMKKDFGSIEETLEFLRRKQPGLQKKSQKYEKQLENIDFSVFGNASNQQVLNSSSQQSIFNNYTSWNKQHNPFQGAEIYNNFQCYDHQKKNDIAFKKTGQDYSKALGNFQELNQPKFSLYSDIQMPLNSSNDFFGSCQDMGVFKDSIFGKGSNENLAGNNYFGFNLTSPKESNNQDKEKSEKVIQCHYYFSKWLELITQLMGEQKQVKKFF